MTYSQDGRTFDLPGGNILDLGAGTGLCTPAQSRSFKKPDEPFYTEPNLILLGVFELPRIVF